MIIRNRTSQEGKEVANNAKVSRWSGGKLNGRSVIEAEFFTSVLTEVLNASMTHLHYKGGCYVSFNGTHRRV